MPYSGQPGLYVDGHLQRAEPVRRLQLPAPIPRKRTVPLFNEILIAEDADGCLLGVRVSGTGILPFRTPDRGMAIPGSAVRETTPIRI